MRKWLFFLACYCDKFLDRFFIAEVSDFLGQVAYILCISISFQTGEHEGIFSLILSIDIRKACNKLVFKLFHSGAQSITMLCKFQVCSSHSVILFWIIFLFIITDYWAEFPVLYGRSLLVTLI